MSMLPPFPALQDATRSIPLMQAALCRRDGPAAMDVATKMIDTHGAVMGEFAVATSLAVVITVLTGLDKVAARTPGPPLISGLEFPDGGPLFDPGGYAHRRALATDFVERFLNGLDDQSLHGIRNATVDGVALIQGLCEVTAAVYAAQPVVP